jgi:hypothetical protein
MESSHSSQFLQEKRIRNLEAKVRYLEYRLNSIIGDVDSSVGKDGEYYQDRDYVKKHGLVDVPVYLPPDFKDN